MSYEDLPARLAEVRSRIAEAAVRSGRDPGAVALVAVTKKLPVEAVLAGARAGLRDFGENYVQEGLAKQQAWERMRSTLDPAMPPVRWHMIGRLQSNKAAAAARSFAMLHGVDSMSVVRAVAREHEAGGATAGLLLQIRLGGEGMRGGIEMKDAESFLRQADVGGGVRFDGLMAVADPERPARPQFARLCELATSLRALGLAHAPMTEISAGMSGDFEDAVAEGATIVRVGTAIFGSR